MEVACSWFDVLSLSAKGSARKDSANGSSIYILRKLPIPVGEAIALGRGLVLVYTQIQ